jgi:hypothetical protein
MALYRQLRHTWVNRTPFTGGQPVVEHPEPELGVLRLAQPVP